MPYKITHLLVESPVRIHAAVDWEAWLDVLLHQIDISQHCAGLLTQLSHDLSSLMCEIRQTTSTALEPTSSNQTTHSFIKQQLKRYPHKLLFNNTACTAVDPRLQLCCL